MTPPNPDDSYRPRARDEEPSFLSRHALGCGVALYAAAAVGDGYVTLEGVGVDLTLEGNPLMRAMMQQLGAEAGLAVQKAAIGESPLPNAAAKGPLNPAWVLPVSRSGRTPLSRSATSTTACSKRSEKPFGLASSGGITV